MPSKQESFDVVIIGGGQAGVPLAFALAKAGRKTVLVERRHLGGSCVNFGCTPTKAAIASARAAHVARNAGPLGVRVERVSVDFEAVIQRARRVATEARVGLEHAFKGSENPLLITGEARVVAKKGQGFEIAVGDHSVLAARIVLNTGTRARLPQVPGLGSVSLMHSDNWLDRTTLPDRLVMVGGGAIGLEMAQFYRRMGSRVTIVEHGPFIAPTEDEDIASEIAKLLMAEGIEIETNAKLVGAEPGQVLIESGGEKRKIAASDVFAAIGRIPNTDALHLDTIGVELDGHGFVKVDNKLRTNVAGVFAAGDVHGGPMFTHTAWDDHRIILPQLVQPHAQEPHAHEKERTTDRVTPYAIFTDPELGRVGLTEKQAAAADQQIRVARYPMANASKAIELGETAGLIKIVVDRRTELILGAAVLGQQGGELVHIFVDAMNARAPLGNIRNAVYIHPTLAEALQSAASIVD